MLAPALLLFWSWALAPLDTIDLTVEGAKCADETKVAEATARYLGRTDLGGLEQAIPARVVIEEVDAGFTVEVAVDLPEPHGSTHRIVEAADCVEALDVAGLIVSVALDPLAVSAAVVPREELEEPEPVAVLPAEEPPPADVLVAPRFAARALGELGVGQHQRAAFGVSLGFAYTAHLWRVGVLARYWVPQRVPLDGNSDAGASIQSLSGGVDVCVSPRHRSLVFPSCLGMEGGFLRAQGYGLSSNAVTRLPLLTASVEQGLIWEASPHFGVRLSLGTGLAFSRPQVEIEGAGTVFSRPRVTFRVGVGPTARF